MWIKNVVDMRIGTELYGEDRIKLESQGMAKTEVKRSSKSATKLKKTEVKVQEEIKTALNASDITKDLIETIKEPSKTTTLAKDEVLEEKYYDYYRTLGYDWRLF